MHMSVDSLLDLTQLEKKYDSVSALKGITLRVGLGKVGLLGPNGAGKTTLMKIVTGLIKPTSGSCKVLGLNPCKGTVLHEKIGYLPENFGFPSISIRKYLLHVGLVFNLSKTQTEDRIEEILTELNLYKIRDRYCTKLSSGQKQRLGIAQVLIHDPEVLILDEPVSYLDPVGRKRFFDFLDNIQGNQSILLSSHILTDVERVCKDVIILNEGQVLYFGPLTKVRKGEKLTKFFLIVSNPSALMDEINGSPFIDNVSIRGRELMIETSEPIHFQESIVRYLANAGVRLMHMKQEEESLEDLFFELVKRNGTNE
ncbi:MAG: ATP-binding cassette domain-containing protein [Candidatus Lokiarchaeota archaeon]|nr:ATP-binding cassette domain-containing protein [Candidatus Lokiarchaeota archaeon]